MEMMAAIGAMPPVDLAALAAVVVIGLPHGALDGAIAMHLGFGRRPLVFIRFLLLYVSMAGLVVGAWMLAPTVCLLGFLLVSMLHFGAGDARHGSGWLRSVEVIAHGGLVVVGISQLHHREVDIIFSYLTGADTVLVWQVLDLMTVLVGLAVLICIGQGLWYRRWRATAVELVALGVLFAMTPPLVGFAVYFCLVHSARHVAGIVGALRRDMSGFALVNQAAWLTVASWMAGGLALWWFADQANPEPVVMRVVFIGLAALTVPHMILVDGIYRRTTSTMKRQFMSR
jgi:Brp/Blh family beta-carotene 15,15'-monooxygenase